MKKRTLSLLALSALLGACGEDNGSRAAPEVPKFADQRLTEGRAVWMGTCRNCHLMGVAGAPAIDDNEAWQPRIEKGSDMLYLSAIRGKKKDGQWTMPPLGGNQRLSRDQVRKAVDFMLAAVGDLGKRQANLQ